MKHQLPVAPWSLQQMACCKVHVLPQAYRTMCDACCDCVSPLMKLLTGQLFERMGWQIESQVPTEKLSEADGYLNGIQMNLSGLKQGMSMFEALRAHPQLGPMVASWANGQDPLTCQKPAAATLEHTPRAPRPADGSCPTSHCWRSTASELHQKFKTGQYLGTQNAQRRQTNA